MQTINRDCPAIVEIENYVIEYFNGIKPLISYINLYPEAEWNQLDEGSHINYKGVYYPLSHSIDLLWYESCGYTLIHEMVHGVLTLDIGTCGVFDEFLVDLVSREVSVAIGFDLDKTQRFHIKGREALDLVLKASGVSTREYANWYLELRDYNYFHREVSVREFICRQWLRLGHPKDTYWLTLLRMIRKGRENIDG
jgi:hypothetical protein